MTDSHKLGIALVILGVLAFMYYTQQRDTMSVPGTGTRAASMPDMQMVTPASTSGLMPADNDTTDYSPYSGSAQPCIMSQPYA